MMSRGRPLEELVNEVGLEKLVFEVSADAHIAWVLKKFGANANLGPNLSSDQVLWLEPMRRGLGREMRYSLFDRK